tara:strand:- start:1477 stop:2361 length:885 start_codon:yes stop_codon:yes gene_type:complete
MNILINRRGSAGDVLLLEPILTYLGKEHTVRLITDHYDIFETSDHNFKVSSRKNIFMPKYDVYISLDDVYENEPLINRLEVLISYTEKQLINYNIEIEPIPYRNIEHPLTTHATNKVDEYKKEYGDYLVAHVDTNPNYTKGRRLHGINWSEVFRYIEDELNITVVEIGKYTNWGFRKKNVKDISTLAPIIKGSKYYIGIDSFPSHLAIAVKHTNILIFFGNTDPSIVYPIITKSMQISQKECATPHCYHSYKGGITSPLIHTGPKNCPLYHDPPLCNTYTTDEIKKIIKENIYK